MHTNAKLTLLVLASLGVAWIGYLWALGSGRLPRIGSETFTQFTGVIPDSPVYHYVYGWEDYTGWFRLHLDRQAVEQVATTLRAKWIGETTRATCPRVRFRPPWWWRAGSETLGDCWAADTGGGGGVAVHFHEASATVTILIFTI